jgi:hypothetical protein
MIYDTQIYVCQNSRSASVLGYTMLILTIDGPYHMDDVI